MKKLFLSLVVVLMAMTANAQVYVGGEIGAWRNWDANHTSFQIQPEVGYNLSDKWAIGASLGYFYQYFGNDVSVNALAIAPYVRYTYAKFGPVNLFLDGGFGLQTYKVKDADKSQNGWKLGVEPGLSVNLTDKLSFISHIGFLGYRDADDDISAWGENGFGFDLSGQNLTFGLYYNF